MVRMVGLRCILLHGLAIEVWHTPCWFVEPHPMWRLMYVVALPCAWRGFWITHVCFAQRRRTARMIALQWRHVDVARTIGTFMVSDLPCWTVVEAMQHVHRYGSGAIIV